jgi:hypothetical protein
MAASLPTGVRVEPGAPNRLIIEFTCLVELAEMALGLGLHIHTT